MENCCPICFEVLEKRDIRYSFPCSHPYHKTCLENLIENKGNCALCRASIKMIINKDLLDLALTPAINLNTVYSLPDAGCRMPDIYEKVSKLSKLSTGL